MGRRTGPRASPPSMRRSTPASPCSTPATSTAWATTSCCCARRCKAARANAIILSVKFGALRDPAGAWAGYDARPAAVKNFLAYTLRRLGTDYIDIYRPARVDPAVPIEDTVGAIAEMVTGRPCPPRRLVGGRARRPMRRARAVHPICRPADRVLTASRAASRPRSCPTCRELGIGITAYGVLSPRPDRRPLVEGPRRRPRVTSAHTARASSRATSKSTSRWSSGCATSRRRSA